MGPCMSRCGTKDDEPQCVNPNGFLLSNECVDIFRTLFFGDIRPDDCVKPTGITDLTAACCHWIRTIARNTSVHPSMIVTAITAVPLGTVGISAVGTLERALYVTVFKLRDHDVDSITPAVRAVADAQPDDAVRLVMYAATRLIRDSIPRYLRVLRNMSNEALRVFLSETLATTATELRSPVADPAWKLPLELPADLWNRRSSNPPDALWAGVLMPFRCRRRAPLLQPSKDAAIAAFNKATHGYLDGVLGENLVACGGMPAYAIRHESDYTELPGDVDLFVVGATDPAHATRIVTAAVDRIKANVVAQWGVRPMLTVQSSTALTIMFEPLSCFKVQFILRVYPDLGEVLHTFDLGSCRVAFDGTTFRAASSGVFSLRYGVNIADPLNLTQASRCMKYQRRGFLYMVPVWSTVFRAMSEFTVSLLLSDPEKLLDLMNNGGLQQVMVLASGLVQNRDQSATEIVGMHYNCLRDPSALFDEYTMQDFLNATTDPITGIRRFPVAIGSSTEVRISQSLPWNHERPGDRVASRYGSGTFYNLPTPSQDRMPWMM